MSTGNDRFNAEAAAWDANPDVHRASDGALQAILAAYPALKRQEASAPGGDGGDGKPDVLEIGCGTGLLSLRLAPYVRSILAVDAARGMTDALAAKLAREDDDDDDDDNAAVRGKITPLCLLLEDPEDPRLPPAAADDAGEGAPRRKFDLVTSHLVLHHIADVRAVLATMLGCLRPGTGEVALTDFEDFGPGARRFHPESKMAGVERHGVGAAWIAGLMREVGFVDVDVGAKWTMEKEVERFPGEWGGEGLERRPKEGAEVMGFPFLLCRGRRP